MLRDHKMARKPGEPGSHKGQGENHEGLELGSVEMCVLPISSSLHIPPWPANREQAMKGGWATAEQTASTIMGAFVLILFTENLEAAS